MKFKVGQTVVLARKSRGYTVKLGDTAKINKTSSFPGNICVVWVKKTCQGNGSYPAKDFEPVIEIGEQLKFSFMSE